MFDVWKRMFPTFFLLSSILMCFSLCVSNPNPNDYNDYNIRIDVNYNYNRTYSLAESLYSGCRVPENT